jgi:hypothetical protein
MGGDVIVMSEMGKGSIRQLRHARGRADPQHAHAAVARLGQRFDRA